MCIRDRCRVRHVPLADGLRGLFQMARSRVRLCRCERTLRHARSRRGRNRPRPRQPGNTLRAVSNRVFSVILLPTAECNVACTYCFEHKEPHRLSMLLVPLLTRQLLDHIEHEGIEECEIYWHCLLYTSDAADERSS